MNSLEVCLLSELLDWGVDGKLDKHTFPQFLSAPRKHRPQQELLTLAEPVCFLEVSGILNCFGKVRHAEKLPG